ncbi:MAG: hypothetical protein HY929_05630 [Euryarchaeota archaeon]|nr:hypothetical protein [Euryarchaeota archaeon]
MYEKIQQKAQAQLKALERIMLVLPGFKGYKEREIRRESDRLIRDKLYRDLKNAEDSLKTIYRELVNKGLKEVWDETDRLIAAFDRIAEKINHTEYGYSGFFDLIKIEERELDNLISFDAQLIDQSKKILDLVTTFKGEVIAKQFGTAQNRLAECRGALDTIEETFERRKDAILGSG